MFGFNDSHIVLFKNELCSKDWFKHTLSEPLILNTFISAVLKVNEPRQVYIALPADMGPTSSQYVISYDSNFDLSLQKPASNLFGYSVIVNGQYVSDMDLNWPARVAIEKDCDVLFVQLDTDLTAGSEQLKITHDRRLAGVRRIFADSAVPSGMPLDWPYLVLIRSDRLKTIGPLSAEFTIFLEQVSTLEIASFSFGSNFLNLNRPSDFTAFLLSTIHALSENKTINSGPSSRYRVTGPVLIGQDVEIEDNALVVGPSIILSGTVIGHNATIVNSILGSNCRIKSNSCLSNAILIRGQEFSNNTIADFGSLENFRKWPLWSYPRMFKRLLDILASLIVLLLFAPVILIIAVLVKATSRGPAFFGDKRQGLHGRNFYCLKFRSMIAGADKLQQKLRKLNEVDGPQFKMEDDPRVTKIGKFLRSTYLDEVPQFWNVLLGKMSIVGPRPSPESENSLCASWRDARLSVRPGITGYWQVSRTRLPGADFQEWVYYDKRYVKNISLRLDLWICWKTAVYILKAFLKQF